MTREGAASRSKSQSSLPDSTVYYPKGLRTRWRTERLWNEWTTTYPGLFDDRDLDLAKSQGRRGYHFGEWYVAIYLATAGYRVVLPKYSLRRRGQPSHKIKFEEVQEQIGCDGMNKLLQIRRSSSGGPPDLFAYLSPDVRTAAHLPFPSRFFAEVKVERDSLSRRQQRTFAQIDRNIAPVLVIHVRERADYRR